MKPQSYDRLSPTCHADITIPVVSIIARADLLVPIQHFNAYYDAVTDAGCIDYYRSYTILLTQHCDATIIGKVPVYFQQLFDWATNGVVPPATPRPLP